MAYQIVVIPMTLSDHEGHSLPGSLLHAIFRTAVQQLTSVSRGPSAIVRFLL